MSINLQNPPKTLKELYEFFAPNLIKPPSKSNYMCSGYHLSRIGWHVEVYRIPKGNNLSMWFYTHPNRGPKWAIDYAKFTNPSQES